MKFLRRLGFAWPACGCVVCRCNRMLFRETVLTIVMVLGFATLVPLCERWLGTQLPLLARCVLVWAFGWWAGGALHRRVKERRTAMLDELRGRIEFAP